MTKHRALQIALEVFEKVRDSQNDESTEAYYILYDMLQDEIKKDKSERWEAWPEWMGK